MDKHLHIITHDVPWPVDFGGIFDLFYKIKTLHEAGIKIHLHCFTKSRTEQSMLNRYCASVDYYPRNTTFRSFSFKVPYIVKSRNHHALLENLKKDNYPILLEGIHCTYLLYKGLLKDRKVWVRLHNVEYLYYRQIASHEHNVFKKIYFLFESYLLKKYERKIAVNHAFIPISDKDGSLYKTKFDANQVNILEAFIPWGEVRSPIGYGSFCLYQGNLEINENEKAALWLLENVFKDLKVPFVIAGKNPSAFLQNKAHEFEHTCIVSNPSDFEMQDMINKAQINILPSFNKTGIKLKILNALFNGRHCITNINAIEASDLVKLCYISNDAQEMKTTIELLFKKPFTETDIEKRRELLLNKFDNRKNAEKLIEWIW